MATVREATLPQGGSQTLEVDTSEGSVLEVAVDPGQSRSGGSADPPIGSYDLEIRDSEGSSIGPSPISSEEQDERKYVTGEIGGLMEVEITNTGTRGTVQTSISILRGDDAVKSALTSISLDLDESRALRLADGSFLNDRVLADDGQVYGSVADAVASASSFVFVGPGTFLESSTTVIDNADFNLFGIGPASFIRGDTDLAGNLIEVDGVDGVTISDLRAETPIGLNVGATVIAGINGASDGTIENVTIRESDADAISIGVGGTGQGWSIEDNRIEGDIGHRGVFEQGAGRASISRNIIDGAGADDSSLGRGIEIQGVRSLVENNRISNTTDDGVMVNGADKSAVQSNGIFVVATGGDPGEGISAEGTEDVAIKDNFIFEADGGIVVFQASAGPHIEGNTIVDTRLGDAIFTDANEAAVVGNRVVDSASNGIECRGDQSAIVGNALLNPGFDESATGIISSGISSVISGNLVFNAWFDGIRVSGEDSICSDNMIDTISEDGIQVGADDVIVEGNHVSGIGAGNNCINADGNRDNIGRNHLTGGDVGVNLNGANQLASDNIINSTTGIDSADATTPTTTDNVIL